MLPTIHDTTRQESPIKLIEIGGYFGIMVEGMEVKRKMVRNWDFLVFGWISTGQEKSDVPKTYWTFNIKKNGGGSLGAR